MKKIWIIHSSDFGNSEKVATQIAEGLKDSYNVRINHINNISPEDIAKDEPYGLISAVRIFGFASDKKIRNYLSKLNEIFTKPVSKFAYFSTHALKWKNFFIRGMKKTLTKMECIEEICPEFLEVQLQGAKGPAREGSEEKISNFISTVKEFMN